MQRLKSFHSRPPQIPERKIRKSLVQNQKTEVLRKKILSVFWKPGAKKREILSGKMNADPMIVAQVLLAQRFSGAAGASAAPQVNRILAGGGGIKDIIHPVRANLRAIARQRKNNGHPCRWALLKRESSLSVGKNRLRNDEKLDALLECLEGPICDTWIASYTDTADSSHPLKYSELFSLLEGRGSKLLQSHY